MEMSRYETQRGEQINSALDKLHLATEEELVTTNGLKVSHKKAIVVDGRVVSVMSKPYQVVQHKDAFKPIIEGITLRGIEDFTFSLWANHKKASIGILIGECEDGVKFGFKCINSFDGTTAINFGFSAYQKIVKNRIVEKEHVLVWTVRQVCSNGATIKVPLKTCKYLDIESVTRIKQIMGEHARILHLGDVKKKLEAVQYMTEAFLLLKEPLNRMIIDAKTYTLTQKKAREFILKYVGKRREDMILTQYGKEEQTLWGLFNSITFLASHGALKDTVRDRLLNNSADMLECELLTKARD